MDEVISFSKKVTLYPVVATVAVSSLIVARKGGPWG